jgi:hypothetical protein
MKIQISIPGIPKKREDHLKGVLVSLLDVTDQILDRRKKTSYLVHFLEERLTKNERREFSNFLKRVIGSLHRTGTPTKAQLSGNSPEEKKLFHRFFSFGRISESATIPRQPSKAEGILQGEDGFITKRIKEASNNE